MAYVKGLVPGTYPPLSTFTGMNAVLHTALSFVLREFDVFLAFSWRDWSTTIIPSFIFSIGAARSSVLPPRVLCYRYLLLLPWSILFVYSFNLSNQIAGVLEDQINKPDRPIPSGKVTLKGAKLRRIVVVSAYLALSLYFPSILPETIGWILTTAFLNLTPAGHHWFGKNCIGMVTGVWAQFNSGWKIISPMTDQSTRFVWAFAFWFGLAAHIQDLRDIEGDTAIGRQTLPIVVGDMRARLLITLIAIPLQALALKLGRIGHPGPASILLALAFAHVIIGWRVMQAGKGSAYDHRTYMACDTIDHDLLAMVNSELPRYSPTHSASLLPVRLLDRLYDRGRKIVWRKSQG